MFADFQHLVQSPGLMKTASDGDCFFDTMAKITKLYTKRGWRDVLGRALVKKGTFTIKQYNEYMYTHEWADYTTVYEAVRNLQRPFCVVQHEYPNAVMLIRPHKVDFTNVLYLVYDHGVHFTSFLHPITPPILIERMKAMERVDMHEEEEGLMVTHGSLLDLVHDTVKESNIENFMRKYSERNGLTYQSTDRKKDLQPTRGPRFAIQEEAYQKKLHPIKSSVRLTNSEYAEGLQAEYDYEDAEKERSRVSRRTKTAKTKTKPSSRTRKSKSNR